jgi:hypothetical protein
MIRAVANKPLDLVDDEFAYYMQITEAYGANVFQDTFETDEEASSLQHGWITMVTPPFNKNLPMGVIFFLFNVMLNQRARKVDQMITKFESMMNKFEAQNGK